MAFTAQDVKALREMTNVGMMDCKKALTECDGDMDKAVEWLREKGLAKAAKKAGRIAAEGMAYAAVCPECGVGAVVEVNCETDFCAKSELFVAFVKDICKVVIKDNPADVEALMNCKYPGSELTVAETLPEKVMSIGENLQIRRFVRYGENTSVAYVHAGGKIGVLVNLAVEGGIDATEIGKDVAMQIAALNPRFWDKSEVTEDVLEQEKKIAMALMDQDPKNASKPAAIKEKIVMGKMNKFYQENCLLQQEFVKDGSMSVEKYIESAAKALGGSVKFVTAVRFAKGEGIEKKEEDFAAEVAAQMNMGKK
ncbi:MAG: translation elongation factor Ts [Oscillospiraceae bacterium]|nr:translation elongation factor Ts [Oscillospiraceae bacterium]